MNLVLWVLQVLAALVYGASGVMKVFMFDQISEGVPSFGALPRQAWTTLGILELMCTVGLTRKLESGVEGVGFELNPEQAIEWTQLGARLFAFVHSKLLSKSGRLHCQTVPRDQEPLESTASGSCQSD